MSATELNPELRKLIDTRLDVIDQILVRAEMTWSERQSIVGEVETQIFELLARRGQIPAQEDLLEVLESLDPPESYIPEGSHVAELGPPAIAASLKFEWVKGAITHASQFGKAAACVTGLVIVNGVVVIVIAISDGAIPWIVTLACLGWLNYTGVRRFCAWSAEHRGNLLDEARKRLAAWLTPKNGLPAT